MWTIRPARSRGGDHGIGVSDARDERLFAERVEAGVQRLDDQLSVRAGRRADVDEVERFARQQVVRRLAPAGVRKRRKERLPARWGRVGRRDDLHVSRARQPGAWPILSDAAEPDEGAAQHPRRLRQARPNRCEIAAKDWSRMSTPRSASSSVMTSGGLMRMTLE